MKHNLLRRKRVKIQKSHLKELIRQSIYELREGGPGSGPQSDDDNPFESSGLPYQHNY